MVDMRCVVSRLKMLYCKFPKLIPDLKADVKENPNSGNRAQNIKIGHFSTLQRMMRCRLNQRQIIMFL